MLIVIQIVIVLRKVGANSQCMRVVSPSCTTWRFLRLLEALVFLMLLNVIKL